MILVYELRLYDYCCLAMIFEEVYFSVEYEWPLEDTDIIFTQPLRSGRIWHKSIFRRSLTGLNSEFSFS